MAAELPHKNFKLVTPDLLDEKSFSPGDDARLRCHLSPEISTVAMEIRRFKEADCIYLYKWGYEAMREGYEGRVSLDPLELQAGDVSLKLKGVREGDRGGYTCQRLKLPPDLICVV
ncbi:butyrophilin-like protein 2 [Engraulis encrasicolus]|uniref:butyrophilin-like protein 2 n=1 Tax=Engraulis encrasicolus TaxID=184585 RepID=UPI002FD56C56